MKKSAGFGVAAIAAICLFGVIPSARTPGVVDNPAPAAAGVADGSGVAAGFLSSLEWRSIGPFRGGRVPAVAGDPDNPLVFYFGSAHGGVWKTTDAGQYWRNISDGFFEVAPVGAIEVSRSNHDVIYVGTGEWIARQHVTPGDGVYKSTDGGRTWANVGLRETRHISKVRINPTNPDIAYVSAAGDQFGPNPDRGVFRTKDGGKTWQKVLFKSDKVGAFDLAMDPTDPNVLYASLNEFQRLPWDEVSGGPDSGIYKTTDGGDTWANIIRNPGMPKGMVGKTGVSVSASRPARVYAMLESVEGGVYRSDDSGATWQRVNANREMLRIPNAYLSITADPQDSDTVYVQHVELWKSTDGGKVFAPVAMQHSDHHSLWIDPKNNKRIIEGSDGGASVTLNGGETWSTITNQPTADLFGLAVDNQEPYWVYAAQNDNSHIGIPSRTAGGAIGLPEYVNIEGGEGGLTAVKPDGSVVYACDRTQITRWDRKTGLGTNISVWPEDEFGAAAKDVKYRFYYTFPILVSPHDPNVLYSASQHLYRSTDEGNSWARISPDLSRNRVDKMAKIPGGPITTVQSSLYYVSLIRIIAESPLEKGELWVGTDDSTVQVSRNGGKSWENVSPKDMPEWTTITNIDVSPHDRGTVYVAAERHRMSDRNPYLYKTTDYGKTWQKITNGIRQNDFTYVVREDPVRRGLLYAGTERGAYVSFDAGASWQSLQRSLPAVAVTNMQVKNNDLVIATHGRGFWIMDNITSLRQITPAVTSASAYLFQPAPTIRYSGGRGFGRGSRPGVQFTNAGGLSAAFEDRKGPDGQVRRVFFNAGQNAPGGVLIEFYVKQVPTTEATLAIIDAKGTEVQKFSNQAKGGRALPMKPGTNRFAWDMRYPNAREAAADVELAGFEASRPSPPVAAPGRFTARLVVDGQTYQQPFEIRKNPLVAATDADLQAQFDLSVKIRERVSEVSDALSRLRDARKKLDAGGAQAAATKAKLLEIEGQLTRLTLSHPLELAPKGLINKLAALSGDVSRGDQRPTTQMYAVFEDLNARVDAQLSQLDQVIKSKVATQK